jgi:hypothetical protein
LQQLALGLDIAIREIGEEGEEGKLLTPKALKKEIALNLGENILIADRAHKWTGDLKGWLEELSEAGHTLLLLGDRRDLEGVLFKVPRLVLPALAEQAIRKIVRAKATELKNVNLDEAKISQIAAKAGGNPFLAQRLVQEFVQGFQSQDGGNYRDITPFLVAIAGLIGALRFVGMATGDTFLRVAGGIGISVFFAMRSLKLLFPKEDRRR